MTSLGEIGLNIRTNASPKRDRTRCQKELASIVGQPHPHLFHMFRGNHPEFGDTGKSVIRSSSVTRSRGSELSDQLRVPLYMTMPQNVM